MSLALADVQTWLTAGAFGAPVDLNRLPDAPDEVVVLSTHGGTSPLFDGAFETVNVLIRCRGLTDQVAESLALAVHAYVSAHEGSFQMGTTYVLTLMPSTGPPAYAGRDVDNRTIYQGAYEFTVQV